MQTSVSMTPLTPRSVLASLCFVAVSACSAGSETSPLVGYDAGPSTTIDADAATTHDSGTSTSVDAGTSHPASGVVVNEVMLGPDWIELKNIGSSTFDLSGWSLADSANGAGTGPKTTERLVFPPNTKIGAGGYLFIRAGQSLDSGVTDTACLDGGVSFCFLASFGLSRSKGDGVYLVKPDQTVSDSTEFGANVVPTGSSWARLPDGTGTFELTATPTPDGANH